MQLKKPTDLYVVKARSESKDGRAVAIGLSKDYHKIAAMRHASAFRCNFDTFNMAAMSTSGPELCVCSMYLISVINTSSNQNPNAAS